MNDLILAGKVLVSPGEAAVEIREHPRFFFPIMLIVAATVAQLFWYYNVVDIEWLKDHMLGANERINAMTPEARERMFANMTRPTMMWSGIIATAVALPLVFALVAAYYLLAGKVTNVQASFRQWFALSAWSGLPALIALLAGAAVLIAKGANAQLGPSDLQVSSLNELFFGRTPGEAGYQLLMSLNLFSFWSWSIAIVAVQRWSNRGWGFSAMFVLLPIIVIYGTWALVTF